MIEIERPSDADKKSRRHNSKMCWLILIFPPEGCVHKFKKTETPVLITNPNTLAESVSLHQECHNAIYYEFGFNLTYLLQSKDRIHRVGLKAGTSTNYYFSITKSENSNSFGSIDSRIYERLQVKANRMKETIESNNLILVKDSTDLEDIKYILDLEQ